MPSTKGKKIKNPCKICFETVNNKTGLQCRGACKKWMHFKCLHYTPGKILDIKKGYVQIKCPCPNCETFSSSIKDPLNCTPYYCGKSQCPGVVATEPESPLHPEKRPTPDSSSSCLTNCDSVTDPSSVLSLCKTNNAREQDEITAPSLPSKRRIPNQDTNSEPKYKEKDQEVQLSKSRYPGFQVRSIDSKQPCVKNYKPNLKHTKNFLKEVLTEAEKDISPGCREQVDKTDNSGGKRTYGCKTVEKNEKYKSAFSQQRSSIGVLTDLQQTVTIATSTSSEPEVLLHRSIFLSAKENARANHQPAFLDKNYPKTRSQSTYVCNSKKKERRVRTRDTHTCPSAKFTTPLFASQQDSLNSLPITDPYGSNFDLQTNALYRHTLINRKKQMAKELEQLSFEINGYRRCKSDSCLIGSFLGVRNPLYNAVEQFNDVISQCRGLMAKMAHFFKGNSR